MKYDDWIAKQFNSLIAIKLSSYLAIFSQFLTVLKIFCIILIHDMHPTKFNFCALILRGFLIGGGFKGIASESVTEPPGLFSIS